MNQEILIVSLAEGMRDPVVDPHEKAVGIQFPSTCSGQASPTGVTIESLYDPVRFLSMIRIENKKNPEKFPNNNSMQILE